MRAKPSERDTYAAGLFASLSALALAAAVATGSAAFVPIAAVGAIAALLAFLRGFPIDRNW